MLGGLPEEGRPEVFQERGQRHERDEDSGEPAQKEERKAYPADDRHLIDQPLAGEPVEGWHSRNGQGPYARHERGHRKGPREPAHVVEVLCARAEAKGAGGEEEERFVHHIVQQVEEAGQQTQERQLGITGQEVDAHADAEKHVSHLADDVEGHQPLGVVLGERRESSHEDRAGAQQGDRDAPDHGDLGDGKEIHEHAKQPVDPELRHRAGEGGGCATWRRRVGVRQPVSEGENPRLGGEGDEEERQQNVKHDGIRPAELPQRLGAGGEAEGVQPRRMPDHDHRHQHEGRRHVCDDQVLQSRPQADGILFLVDHEEVGADRHELPEHEEEEPVSNAHDSDHPDEEQQKDGPVAGGMLALVYAHESGRVERAQEGHDRDDHEKEGAELIQAHRQAGADAVDGGQHGDWGTALGAEQAHDSAPESDCAGGGDEEEREEGAQPTAARGQRGDKRAEQQQCARVDDSLSWRHTLSLVSLRSPHRG